MATTPRPQTSPLIAELLAIGVLRLSADGTTILTPAGTAFTLAGEFVSVATTTQYGVVKQSALVPNAVAAPTKAEFDGLLTALKNAGLMATA